MTTTEHSRRDFVCAIAGCAAAMAAGGCSDFTHTPFFKKCFRDMRPQQIAVLLADLTQKNKHRFGRDVEITATTSQPGVEFGYALDLSRCVGCRRCVHACVEENNQSRDPQIHWIRVLEMEKQKGIDFAHADPYYEAEEVPREGHFYLPVACQQCENPPCVSSCPVGATWQEPDGITVIDPDWCIGCRCCISACPYGARHFNWAEPEIPAAELNPQMHVIGNRPRPKGVVEKCTFCIQRVRSGRYPACVEACPVGARKFGNLLDPASEIRQVLDTKNVFVLKSELNTRPRFFYFYGD